MAQQKLEKLGCTVSDVEKIKVVTNSGLLP